jgi:hypothetical protein
MKRSGALFTIHCQSTLTANGSIVKCSGWPTALRVTGNETYQHLFPDSLDIPDFYVYSGHHKVYAHMIKRFITWLYATYVIVPAAKAAIRSFDHLREDEIEITFTPDEEFEAIIEASKETKH